MELSGQTYTASAGETADSIALAVYGKEKYAAELLCANPGLCGTIRMRGGEIWQLPVIDTPTDGQKEIPEKAPWKEE